MAHDDLTDPVPEDDLVRWGATTVSRRSYEMARELLSAARQPALQDNLQPGVREDSPDDADTNVRNSHECPQLTSAVDPIVESRLDADSYDQMMQVRNGARGAHAVRETMSASEVAFEAGASYRTVRRWIHEGKLAATKTKTGRIRILRTEFRKFMGLEK